MQEKFSLKKYWLKQLNAALDKRKLTPEKIAVLLKENKSNISNALTGKRYFAPDKAYEWCLKLAIPPHEVFNLPLPQPVTEKRVYAGAELTTTNEASILD
ncbi:MAG: helix-turn-helix transcriptional regulator [Bacteroidetes bacterium]|nr:helix-turn-helix transcriptional regulator [Bacteroidota bacterium]